MLKLKNLPESPGCYLMRDEREILYVGKAVNLKNRVRSYFQSSRGHSPKVRAMVSRIRDFDVMLCQTNLEALMLESNLIKLHRPHFNIVLKDDKQYPFVRIDLRKPFPLVELVRRTQQDGAKYFGPYIGATTVREVLDLLRQIFPVRSCSLVLPDGKSHRPCIQHEIGNCLAPCAGKCDEAAYHEVIARVMAFLNGQNTQVIAMLREQMTEAARTMQYERAGVLRDRMQAVEQLQEKQRAVKPGGGDQDAIAVAQDGLDAMVQVLRVRGGQVIGGESYALERAGDDPLSEVLSSFILQFYSEEALIPKILLAQALPEEASVLAELLSELRGNKVELVEPQRGERKALVELALKNATDALQKRNAHARVQYERTLGAADALAQALGLDRTLRRIECYDISNTQGELSVASMVVFLDGKPAPKQYRHFRIKTVQGANDFASMEEVLGRRLRHGLTEAAERLEQGLAPEDGRFSDLPDLLVIDGGPEQLEFARRAMLEAGVDLPICSLAKRLEEIFLPDRPESILLERHDPALHLVERIRDEAHRFAIGHHRKLRQKKMTHSALEDIPGIGPARRRALLTHFKNMAAIKAASLDELAAVPNMSRPAAETVYARLHPEAAENKGQ